MTLSTEDLARFGGVFDFDLMSSGITREALAEELGGIHVSQFSKLKAEPDLVKVWTFAQAVERLRHKKRDGSRR
jgi:hypothetical protein